jgi:hypothetical protein
MFAGSLSAFSRRAFLVVGMAVLMCGAPSLLAQAQAQTPAPEAPDPLKFTGDFVLLVYQVKSDKAADFESGWAAVKDKLSKSDKPDLKELGESLKIFKLNTPAAAGADVVYVFHLNPPSKTQSYDPTKIIYFSGAFPDRPEADAVYKKISEALKGITPWPLLKIG